MNCQINLFSIVNPSPFLLLSDWSTRIPAHKESLILLISQTTIETVIFSPHPFCHPRHPHPSTHTLATHLKPGLKAPTLILGLLLSHGSFLLN